MMNNVYRQYSAAFQKWADPHLQQAKTITSKFVGVLADTNPKSAFIRSTLTCALLVLTLLQSANLLYISAGFSLAGLKVFGNPRWLKDLPKINEWMPRQTIARIGCLAALYFIGSLPIAQCALAYVLFCAAHHSLKYKFGDDYAKRALRSFKAS